MAAGLYGKLIAKRDFIAVDLPSGFLPKWEPWLQGAVTGANLKLGGNWQRIFFTAPIWRFWLGRDVLGLPAIGVLMPSVDGVGRQFPLCLVVPAPQGRVFKPLFQDAQASWFNDAEDFLLSTLDEGVAFESTLHRLKLLREPQSILAPDLPDGVSDLPSGMLALTTDAGQPELPLRLLQYARLMRDEPQLSFWWTIGGEDYPPTSFAVAGLPEAELFLRMLQSPVPPDPIAYSQAAPASVEVEPSQSGPAEYPSAAPVPSIGVASLAVAAAGTTAIGLAHPLAMVQPNAPEHPDAQAEPEDAGVGLAKAPLAASAGDLAHRPLSKEPSEDSPAAPTEPVAGAEASTTPQHSPRATDHPA